LLIRFGVERDGTAFSGRWGNITFNVDGGSFADRLLELRSGKTIVWFTSVNEYAQRLGQLPRTTLVSEIKMVL